MSTSKRDAIAHLWLRRHDSGRHLARWNIRILYKYRHVATIPDKLTSLFAPHDATSHPGLADGDQMIIPMTIPPPAIGAIEGADDASAGRNKKIVRHWGHTTHIL